MPSRKIKERERKEYNMATTFTNQATLSFNGGAVQSNVAVGAVEGAVSVSKNAVAEEYSSGDTVTYIVSLVNNVDTALDGLTVTDNLGAYAFGTGTVQPLTYVDGSLQYYLDGVLQPAPAADASDGLVISGIGVPASGSAMLVYSARVNEYAPLGEGSEITNTVVVTGGSVCGAQAEETIHAVSAAQLSLIKSVTPVPVEENGELTYTFQMQNTGNTAVAAEDGAVISDTFDPLLSDIRVSLDGKPLTAGTDYTYNETTGVFGTAEGILTVPAATRAQDPVTGAWTTTPGSSTLIVTGTIGTLCDIIEEL